MRKRKNKKDDKNYVNNKMLLKEVIKSKKMGELTPEAFNMLLSIIDNLTNNKMIYLEKADKEDCYSEAVYQVLKNWKKFDPKKSDNAFSFFTQVIKNGLAIGWNSIHKLNKKQIIRIDELNRRGD
jgi:glucan phosphorylase